MSHRLSISKKKNQFIESYDGYSKTCEERPSDEERIPV
jgi:hypothetical protein